MCFIEQYSVEFQGQQTPILIKNGDIIGKKNKIWSTQIGETVSVMNIFRTQNLKVGLTYRFWVPPFPAEIYKLPPSIDEILRRLMHMSIEPIN